MTHTISEPIPASQLSDAVSLLHSLQDLRERVADDGHRLFEAWRPSIHRRSFLLSALNLAQYLCLRRHDLRPLQAALTPWGLSSLGRSEGRVLPSLDAVLATLAAICDEDRPRFRPPALAAFLRGPRRLASNVDALFGPAQGHRRIRIMVTLPSEAATDPRLIRDLVVRGMDCARINCAHDDAASWARMVDRIRAAAREAGRGCRILMDLAGPKIRLDEVALPAPDRRVAVGHVIFLRKELVRGPGAHGFHARLSIPSILERLRAGAPVWINDGKIGAQVESVAADGVVLRVTQARAKGEKLGTAQGVNFPGTDLQLPALTEDDRRDLDFVAAHADLVGYSFVQEAADVAALQEALAARRPGKPLPPLVAKIETQRAVANLPAIIVQAAGREPLGVMIARGDLAVEIGYQRLAEIQEEILWVCEAAHVPVIWATQVLEQLVKKGVPSRAEVTDAAMAERAECVMLNKGPFVAQAVTWLDDVLTRMEAHQIKKSPQLRALGLWQASSR